MSPREVWSRCLALLARTRTQQRIDEETEFHLAMLEEKYRQSGLDASAARARARREFGSLAAMQETYREQAGWPWFDDLRRDLHYGWRAFCRTPGLTFLIVLTLGLGIGANTAIFSFLDELLLKPLPYRDARSLVRVGRIWNRTQLGALGPRDYVSARDHAQSFAASGLAFLTRGENLEAGGQARHAPGTKVSEGYFRTLGVNAMLGRLFTAQDDVPQGPKVVLLSEDLWRSLFGGDPAAIGRTVRVGGEPHTVVGVLPEWATRRERGRFWTPLQLALLGNDENYTMVARLKPGATAAQAQSELEALWQREHPSLPTPLAGVRPLAESEAAEFRQPVLLLYLGVCIVLLVAALNVGNLLLSRAAARAKEVAVRASLGAGRARLLRQMLTESVLLAAMGGAAGLALGAALVRLLASQAPEGPLRDVRLDERTLLFTLGLSLAVGLLFGLAPAWHALRLDLVETLKTGTAKANASLLGRQGLVIAQVALSMMLLAGAGLLVRTVINLRAVHLGFEPQHVFTAAMALNETRKQDKQALMRYYDEALTRIRQVRGVQQAAVVTQLPVEGQFNLPLELLDSAQPQLSRGLQFRAQTHDAFAVLGMQIRQGRGFASADRLGTPPVAVVNEAFVRQMRARLGDRLGLRRMGGTEPWTIVGVVNDVREVGLKRPAPPVVYMLAEQLPQRALTVVHSFVPAKWMVRLAPEAAGGSSNGALREVTAVAGALDAAQPFQEFRPMDEVVGTTIRQERFLMALLGAFAALTLVMAASGLYGTLEYAVLARRKEIGIRLALGARGVQVAGLVARQALALTAGGLGLGLAGAYWTTQWMKSFLFELKPADPASLAAAGLILLLVSTVAALGPSWRAVRLDPLETLRRD